MEATTRNDETWSHQQPLGSALMHFDIAIFWGVVLAAIVLGPRTTWWIVGLLLAAIGFALWMLARHQLGEAFRLRAAATKLVTHGLYRYFRHPIYLFGGLALFGALLALQNWWVLAIWIIYSTPIQWLRLRKEEDVLESKFGVEYIRLRDRTWV